jgi:hypothetical protein
VDSALRIAVLFLLNTFAVRSGFAISANDSQPDQSVQVVEATAKKYEYSPSPIR